MDAPLERIISLKSLFYYLVKRLKVILIAAVVCAVLFGGLGLVRAEKARSSGNAGAGASQEAVTAAEEELKQLEISDKANQVAIRKANDTISANRRQIAVNESIIADYSSSIESVKAAMTDLDAYMDQSVLMKIDPYNAPVYTVTYHAVSSSGRNLSSDIDPLDEFLSICSTFTLPSESLEKSSFQAYGIDPIYVSELFSVVCNATANTINIVCTGTDREMTEKLSEVCCQALEAKAAQTEDSFSGFSLEKYSDSFLYVIDETLLAKQNKYASQLSDYSSKLLTYQNNIVTKESDIEKLETAVFEQENSLSQLEEVASDNETALLALQNKINGSGSQTTQTASSFNQSIKAGFKKGIIGFVLGAVVAAVVIVLIFFCSPAIHGEEEIRQLQLFSFGTFSDRTKTTRLNRRIQKKDPIPDLTAGNEVIAAKINNFLGEDSKVLLCLSGNDIGKEPFEALKKQLELQHPCSVCCNLDSEDSISLLAACSDIAFIVKKENTKMNTLAEQVHLVNKFNKKILGVIILSGQ